MLYSANDIRKCRINATDGEIGTARDLFFDDRNWVIRYVVVDTGNWLPGRQVLVPRQSLGKPDWKVTELDVDLTREQIQSSPGVDADPPLARDAKLRYYQSHVWTSHPWGGFIGGVPTLAETPSEHRVPPHKVTEEPETHLRSAREIKGYRIEAKDGDLGHIDDFLFSSDDWTIHYVVIDTRNWLPGKKVVVPPQEVSRVKWPDETAGVDLTKAEIEEAPHLESSKSSKVFGPRLMVIQ